MGWRAYADYRFAAAPTPHVDIWLGPIEESEALLGFMHAVLPLGLPLFGIEPLHGSAVVRGEEAVLMIGPAGAGKSTLAAALEGHGYRFLSDDACAIAEDGSVLPGPPLAAHYSPPPTHDPVADYAPKVLATPRSARTVHARPARVVALASADGGELSCAPLSQREAFMEILSNVRGPSAQSQLRAERQLWVSSLLSELPAARVRCDLKTHAPEQVAAAIAEWADGAAPETAQADR